MAAYSYKRHSEISAEELSRKWGIDLEKVKANLNFMMHIDIMSSILSLTNKYWTDLLSQNLMRLIVKFYTDNLFSDDNYVRGNKCAQIYANRDGYLHVLSMRYKAKAGDSLVDMVNTIGIMKEIHCEKHSKESVQMQSL